MSAFVKGTDAADLLPIVGLGETWNRAPDESRYPDIGLRCELEVFLQVCVEATIDPDNESWLIRGAPASNPDGGDREQSR